MADDGDLTVNIDIGATADVTSDHLEDFITVVKVPAHKKPNHVVELRRYDRRQGEFTVTQCSEPLGKIEAQRLAMVWSEFHRLEIR